MKHFKSVLAMLLALVMILSCVGGAFAADKTEVTEIAGSKGSQAVLKEAKGFKSEKFQANNTYKYADDEVVRAIVVLEGSPEADVAERSTTKAANTRAKLQNQHANVRKAMSGIDYEIAYEFTTLLNGFSCDVAYGDLDKIADIDGVEAVYIANSYAAPELETSDKKVMVSNNFTGNYQAMGNGFDGAGMVIAVLDTGLLTTHEAFQDALGVCAETGALTEDDLALAVAPGVYINGKVPFAYDYADKDADVTDNNGHGTHVSGIATGYAADTEEGAITFCGASPAAQLLAMKIFHDDEPGTTSDIYFYALEDAYRLGADVINMSIGAQNGFTYDSSLETEVFGNIYNRLDKAGVILSVAAGNEYSMAQYSAFAGYIGPEYPDYGTVASPSTYEGNTSVASLENLAYPSYVITIGEESFSYVDSSDDQLWLKKFANTETEFVVVPDGEGGIALGNPEDFEAVDVTGKIAVVQRGEISFQEKVDNAKAAGAIGCIVVNNQPGVISMAIDPFAIPAISVQQDAAESFLSAESAVVVTPEEMETVFNPDGGMMSDFSNWGTTPMLTLDPTMTSFGGKIYSSVNTGDSDYDVYSGTSMAAPNMTGTFSNVLSYLAQNYPELSKTERAELAEALLEGTAWVLMDEEDYPYSVRKQGAGLGNAWDAITALQSTAYITDPLKELGDDPEKTGEYVFDVTFTNDSESDAHYNDLYAYVLMDYVANANTEDDPIYVNTLTSDLVYGYGGEDDHAEITYTVKGEEVTEFDVAAGESVTVTVSIVLDDAIKAYFDEMFKNGTYVEGFVFFDQTDAETGKTTTSCHATFLAFYGDWTQAPILEQADFRDFLDADYYVNTTVVDEDGNTLADYGDTALDYLDYYTSPNMGYTLNTSTQELFYYLGGNILDYEPFVESHISFSTPESDGTYYYADAFYLEPYQLRNARHLIMTVTDAETGEVYYVDDTEYLPKAVYDVDAQDWLATGSFMWDGTDADGNYVPSGTVAHVQFDAVLPYSHDEAEDGTLFEDVWSFDVTVDYTAPVIESVVFDPEAETLTVTASDEQYLQAIYLADYEYEILDYATFSSDVAGESFTATFDVSGLIADGMDSVVVTALDYATNETDAMAYFTIELCNHSHTEVRDAVAAGCETQGYSGNTYCADCGALLAEGSVIAATGHNWDAGVISKPTTCTEDGTRTYLCANCGQTRVETIKASGHIFGDWVVTKPATAAVEGEQQRTCAICGFVETAEIDALGYQKCYVVSFDDCGKVWYHEAIDFAVANGLMNGVANTKFDPEGTMSRAMVVTALYREAGEPEVTAPSTFTDVAEGQWYSDAIAWAQDTKVVDGVAADKFAPNDDVTREQLATILWRYSGRPEAKADLSKYEDADEISAYALTAMNWAVEQGIFSGDNGKLKPTANATRAEFATMLMRFLGGSYECDHMKNVE